MGESDNNSIMLGVSRELEVEGLLLKAAASRQGASHEDKRLEEKTWPSILIVGDVGIFFTVLCTQRSKSATIHTLLDAKQHD